MSVKTVRGRSVLESALKLLAELAALRLVRDAHGVCSASKHDADAVADMLRNRLG